MSTCIFISPNVKTIETFLEYCQDTFLTGVGNNLLLETDE